MAQSGSVVGPGEPRPMEPISEQQASDAAQGAREIEQLDKELSSGQQSGRMRTASPRRDPNEMDPAAAHSALQLMLSSEPPPTESDIVKLARLTEHFQAIGKLPTPDKEDDPSDLRFHFWIRVRGVDDSEFERLEERAMRDPRPEERRENPNLGKIRDGQKFNRLLLVEAIIEPDFHRPEWQQYGSPENVISRWLVPGEIQRLAGVVMDLSGWSSGAVERARKS